MRPRRGDVRASSRARSKVSGRSQLGARLKASDGRLRVDEVTSGSVAAQAGLQASDEIISINAQLVATEAEFNSRLRVVAEEDGNAVIRYRRNGRPYDARVYVTAHSPSDQSERQNLFFRGPGAPAEGTGESAVQNEGLVQKGESAAQKGESVQKAESAAQKGGYYYGTTYCGGHHRHAPHCHGHGRHYRRW